MGVWAPLVVCMAITMPIRGILFDLDGTLVDSLDLTVACFTHACRQHLGVAPSREWILGTIGRPLREALEEAAPGRCDELLDAYTAYHVTHHDRLLRPFPAAMATARRLHERGLALGIVTSKRRAAALRALAFYQLVPLFTTIITLEDTTRHKPAPDPLIEGAARLGLPPTAVVYVGDSAHDIRAAQAATMPAAAALWGAGTRTELAALEPDVLLAAPDDLLHWLAQR